LTRSGLELMIYCTRDEHTNITPPTQYLLKVVLASRWGTTINVLFCTCLYTVFSRIKSYTISVNSDFSEDHTYATSRLANSIQNSLLQNRKFECFHCWGHENTAVDEHKLYYNKSQESSIVKFWFSKYLINMKKCI
jgi:hypothetical protein